MFKYYLIEFSGLKCVLLALLVLVDVSHTATVCHCALSCGLAFGVQKKFAITLTFKIFYKLTAQYLSRNW
jgi:hypothetical protein